MLTLDDRLPSKQYIKARIDADDPPCPVTCETNMVPAVPPTDEQDEFKTESHAVPSETLDVKQLNLFDILRASQTQAGNQIPKVIFDQAWNEANELISQAAQTLTTLNIKQSDLQDLLKIKLTDNS